VRDPVQEPYAALKKLQLEPKLNKESEGAVERLRGLAAKLAKKRGGEGLGALGANVEREHAAALRAAGESGLYRSREGVDRLRAGAIVAAERRSAALREAVDKHAFDRLAAVDESLLDEIDGDVAGSVDHASTGCGNSCCRRRPPWPSGG
jgi:hypothetical protein